MKAETNRDRYLASLRRETEARQAREAPAPAAAAPIKRAAPPRQSRCECLRALDPDVALRIEMTGLDHLAVQIHGDEWLFRSEPRVLRSTARKFLEAADRIERRREASRRAEKDRRAGHDNRREVW